MHTPLSFGLRDTLNTVNPSFKLQSSIHIFPGNFKDHLLKTSICTFIIIYNSTFPAFTVGILIIHFIKISRKNTGFISTCTGTNLHHDVFGIFRILWNQHHPDLFIEFRQFSFSFLQLEFCHFCHLRITTIRNDLFRFFDVFCKLNIFFTHIHECLQIFIFLVQFYITLLIRYNIRLND